MAPVVGSASNATLKFLPTLAPPGVMEAVLNWAVPVLPGEAERRPCAPGFARLKISLPRSLVDIWRD